MCMALGLAGMAQAAPKLQSPVMLQDVPASKAPQASTSQAPPPAAKPSQGAVWAVRCPFDFADASPKARPRAGPPGDEALGPHGVKRVTRHSGFWSFGLACLGAGLCVPSAPQAAWLAMPSLVALVGGAHQDYRHRRGEGGYLPAAYDAATSNVPFVALLSGAQGDVSDALRALLAEVKQSNALLGAGAAAVWVLRQLVR